MTTGRPSQASGREQRQRQQRPSPDRGVIRPASLTLAVGLLDFSRGRRWGFRLFSLAVRRIGVPHVAAANVVPDGLIPQVDAAYDAVVVGGDLHIAREIDVQM